MVNPDSMPRYADPNDDPLYAGPERTCGECAYMRDGMREAYCVRDLLVADDPEDADLVPAGVGDESC